MWTLLVCMVLIEVLIDRNVEDKEIVEMKKYRITEWDPIRYDFCVWEDYFASAADAYSAIEYFGSIELITE